MHAFWHKYYTTMTSILLSSPATEWVAMTNHIFTVLSYTCCLSVRILHLSYMHVVIHVIHSLPQLVIEQSSHELCFFICPDRLCLLILNSMWLSLVQILIFFCYGCKFLVVYMYQVKVGSPPHWLRPKTLPTGYNKFICEIFANVLTVSGLHLVSPLLWSSFINSATNDIDGRAYIHIVPWCIWSSSLSLCRLIHLALLKFSVYLCYLKPPIMFAPAELLAC